MECIVSEVGEKNFALTETLEKLKRSLNKQEGFIFVKHPLFISSGLESSSIYVVSRYFGSIIIDVLGINIDNIRDINGDKWQFGNWDLTEAEILEEGSEKIFVLQSRIVANRDLRKFSETDNRLSGKYMLYLPRISRSIWEDNFSELFKDRILFDKELEEYFDKSIKKNTVAIPDDIWNNFIRLLTGTHNLAKLVRKAENENTKAGILRKVESELQIMDFDIEQIKVAQQVPGGPQRIRGLAGTGKTIVLAMKAAHMHLHHPDWTIVYSFNTQSLYVYINDLIRRFFQFWAQGREPDWSKLKILHGWGGKNRDGLYSYVCNIMGNKALTYTEAKDFFEYKQNCEVFGKCCSELLKNNPPELFDAIIIDEAQDFDKEFFKLCYKILKAPKRLIWAYDELQSLEDINIPTAKDIFGVDKDGIPLIELDGVYPGGIEKDFILYKAYRNPRIILMLAHFYGMGLLRKGGPIQFIQDVDAWEDLGYKIVKGVFEVGKPITITRLDKNSPNSIEKYVSPRRLITVKTFKDKEEELTWISESIYKDINEEKLRPEDILVIGFNRERLFDQFSFLKNCLIERNINSIITGKDAGRDVFSLPNFVTLSTVFKAKGNESPIVYIFNFENSELKDKIIQNRNMAFASITRTKGWCNITGSGPIMEELEKELNLIIHNYPNIEFLIPDMAQIKRHLDNVDYEKRRTRIKKANKAMSDAIKELKEIDGDDLPDETKRMFLELAEKFQNKGKL